MKASLHSRSFAASWHKVPWPLRAVLGLLGSTGILVLVWQTILIPMQWPPLGLVAEYFWTSLTKSESYLAALMTGVRAIVAMSIGFVLALLFSILTGRTILGWIGLFFLLLVWQKIPSIAMIHVFVKSKLGIGFVMTVTLAASVVLTSSWLILHHRVRTLDQREVFALRVVGFRGWQLALYGLLPHMGSSIGGAARLGMSVALMVVVLGEWQGVWSDGSIWQFGLGVEIGRAYDAVHSQARVLAWCLWLGLLGALLDGVVQAALRFGRIVTGVELKR